MSQLTPRPFDNFTSQSVETVEVTSVEYSIVHPAEGSLVKYPMDYESEAPRTYDTSSVPDVDGVIVGFLHPTSNLNENVESSLSGNRAVAV